VAAHALGMNKIVSEDALRRALERIDEASSTAWMRPALTSSESGTNCRLLQSARPGQLVFFAEFLATTGVFERWVSMPFGIPQWQRIGQT
jgi:hypothetical protein